MALNKLNEMLGALQTELEKTDSLTPQSEEKLKDLAREIDSLLKHNEKQKDLMTNMKEALEEFEIDHPKLTKAVEGTIESLSKMGI